MIEVIWGTTKSKPITSRQLADHLKSLSKYDGCLFIGYPIIGTAQGAFSIDALLVTEQHGIVIFDLIEGKDHTDFSVRQDESFTKLKSKLIQNTLLTKRRDLAVPLTTVSFAPAMPTAPKIDSEENKFACNESELTKVLRDAETSFLLYKETLSVIQAITGIRRGRKRNIIDENSRGAKVKKLEDSIANLDSRQSRAVIETFDGVQRVRGLAGSGKTIVLALKVAYLHAQHPEWKIGITFNTRALKGYLKKLITDFVLEQTNEEPDWEHIHVLNAWGAPGDEDREGFYFNFCAENSIRYYDFGSAAGRWGKHFAFRGAVSSAITECKYPKEKYDVFLIDEAQDFFPEFLQLCYKITKAPKRLIYAYDELQTLNNDESLPPPEELFGKDEKGNPVVTFNDDDPDETKPKQDIILEKCYRNSLPVLTTAHALGFGIYAEGGDLVQMFDQPYLWKEIGYAVESGSLEEGQEVVLSRTNESSPAFLHEHSPIDDLIFFKGFETIEEEVNWVADEIQKNIEQDELRPEDIIVINANPMTTRDAVGPIRVKLNQRGIKSEIAGVSTSPDIFFAKDSVIFTGIYRAKGNEAPMVYIINSQYYYAGRAIAERRNALFTAITRSKAWVRVLGVGHNMEQLSEEFQRVKSAGFKLQFIYPTESQRRQMRILNRDTSKAEKSRIAKGKTSIDEIIKLIADGEARPEDFQEELELLNKLIGKNG